MVTPSKTVANVLCNFQEILWASSTRFWITLNNWGNESVTSTKGKQVGSVEPAVVVLENDPVWAESSMAVLLCQTRGETERNKQLKDQLQIGVQLTSQERDQMEQMLMTRSDVFALSDEELGEIDLVLHIIDTGDVKPVKTLSRRLTYICIMSKTERIDEEVD